MLSAKLVSIFPFPRWEYTDKGTLERNKACLNETNKLQYAITKLKGEIEEHKCQFCYQVLSHKEPDEYIKCDCCSRTCCTQCRDHNNNFNWHKIPLNNDDDDHKYICLQCKNKRDNTIYNIVPS